MLSPYWAFPACRHSAPLYSHPRIALAPGESTSALGDSSRSRSSADFCPIAPRASTRPVDFAPSLSRDLLKLMSDQFAFSSHWRQFFHESMYLTREIWSAIFD